MNTEHDDEKDAKTVVESYLGQDLRYADFNGEVDYVSAGCQGVVGCDTAVEVTRVTSKWRRKSAVALDSSISKGATVELMSCWGVMVSATGKGLGQIQQSASRLAQQLEQSGIDDFDLNRDYYTWVREGVNLELLRGLWNVGIKSASVFPCPDMQEHAHEVTVLSEYSGTSSGSDSALAEIVLDLNAKKDNFRKLSESAAAQKHLFVWIDSYTEYSIERPLWRTGVARTYEHFQLPTQPPCLQDETIHLWIVHESERRGWYWDLHGWHSLEDV